MGEYLTVIFIITLYLTELSGKVVILCLHTLERARQCRLIKFRAIDFVSIASVKGPSFIIFYHLRTADTAYSAV